MSTKESRVGMRLFALSILVSFFAGIAFSYTVPFLNYTGHSLQSLQSATASKETLSGEEAVITKVIDGDTVVANGRHIRLLGMDSDEKGYPCYTAAKKRLEELVLNKKVVLKRGKKDRGYYGRYLRYIFLNNTNINVQLVKEGLAIARFFPDSDIESYKNEILSAEKYAMEHHIGCKWKETP